MSLLDKRKTVTPKPDYRFETIRLKSYNNFPNSSIDPGKLAAAGFYYTREGDRVQCFECNVTICQWVEGDDPITDHKRWQEHCRFVRNISCSNVPLGENPSSIPSPKPEGCDVSGPLSDDSESTCAPIESQLPSATKLGSLGINRPKGPSYPEYANYPARLRTFQTWSKSMPPFKEMLVEAGFYYTGKGDQTLCYYCCGGLKDWKPHDDPWEQHAKWFSTCCYLLTVKGQAYVNQITGQTMTPPSTKEIMHTNLPSYIKKIQPPATLKTEAKSEVIENSCVAGLSSMNICSVEAAKLEAPEIAKPEIPETNVVENSEEMIENARLCKICYAEELGVLFLPCGHLIACVKCAPGMTTCALCRQSISLTARAFFA